MNIGHKSNSSNDNVCVVVLAWNQVRDTLECISSILKSKEVSPQIILVDNGSIDNTSEIINKYYGDYVKTIRSEVNLGVPRGYNLGLRYAFEAEHEHILITNNDVIVDDHMISHLIKFAKNTPNIGIVSPLILNYFYPQQVWMIGAYWRSFPPTLKMIGYNQRLQSMHIKNPTELDFVPSCCYLLSKRLISDIGYFDEGYFIYFDDWDYSIRARKAGYSIWVNPNAVAWHKVSLSTHKQNHSYKWWRKMGYSASRYYRKYHSKKEFILGIGWMAMREFLRLKPIEGTSFLLGVIDEAYDTKYRV
ncbi:MAG: glycosyltransferase family 2 protein [Thermosphaera sp.]